MRIVLTLLLLVAAAPAWADWVKVGTSENTVLYVMSEKTVYYIDPTSITVDGNVRKVWELHDMSDKGPRGERSVLASMEYDCAQKLMRTLNATGHSAPMARGEIIKLGQQSDDWLVLPKGKDGEIFYKILDAVCAR